MCYGDKVFGRLSDVCSGPIATYGPLIPPPHPTPPHPPPGSESCSPDAVSSIGSHVLPLSQIFCFRWWYQFTRRSHIFYVYGVIDNVLQSCARWSLAILYFTLCFTLRFVYYKHSKIQFHSDYGVWRWVKGFFYVCSTLFDLYHKCVGSVASQWWGMRGIASVGPQDPFCLPFGLKLLGIDVRPWKGFGRQLFWNRPRYIVTTSDTWPNLITSFQEQGHGTEVCRLRTFRVTVCCSIAANWLDCVIWTRSIVCY